MEEMKEDVLRDWQVLEMLKSDKDIYEYLIAEGKELPEMKFTRHDGQDLALEDKNYFVLQTFLGQKYRFIARKLIVYLA